jgi:hypothetical protein
MDLSHLSAWQRIKRKISLLGGSYVHPDGHIELDFEGPAGIDRNDSDEVQQAKLQSHENRQGIKNLKLLYFVIGGVVVYVLIKYFHW